MRFQYDPVTDTNVKINDRLVSKLSGPECDTKKQTQWPVSLITSAEYRYQNPLRVFHFHANIQLPKRMERQLL